jgi:hypothetical protein
MKTASLLCAACVAFALLLGTGLADDTATTSGPQVAEKVPGPFHPLNCTGDFAGQKQCLYCLNGDNPVAMIFARKTSEPLTRLIKKIDAETAKNKDAHMGSFVVFLSDTEGLDKELKALAEKENITKCVLSIDNPAGPKGYNVSKDAEVTVVLYTEHVVKANHAFKSSSALKDEAIDKVVGDVAKILPQK